MTRSFALAAAAVLLATGTSARECRPAPGAPPGVRAPLPKECAGRPPAKPFSEETVRSGREAGFVDLGGGSSLRIGGRIRVDVGVRQ
jgi:hypothetical protein